jgi:hypothetical protein
MPFRLDADFVPVIKIRPHTTFWSPISPGRPSQSPELPALARRWPSAPIDEKYSSPAADICTLESVMRGQNLPPARPRNRLPTHYI